MQSEKPRVEATMTTKPERRPFVKTFGQPRRFAARLILADLLAKRGEGPLERKRLAYRPRKR
jgi:hypothetical protein